MLFLIIILLLYNCGYGEYRTWFIYISPIFRLMEYTLGMSLRQVVGRYDNGLILNKYVVVFLFSGYLLFLCFGVFGNSSAVLHVAFIALLFWNPETFVTKILSLKSIVWLSKYCLYIYMSHCIFLALFSHLGGVRIPLALFCSVCFGMGYEYVSRFAKSLYCLPA